jgi:hypothetical protein
VNKTKFEFTCTVFYSLCKEWRNMNSHICPYFKPKAAIVEESMEMISWVGRE